MRLAVALGAVALAVLVGGVLHAYNLTGSWA
jgi:hypothetical protein